VGVREPRIAEQLRRLHLAIATGQPEVRADDVERLARPERGTCPDRAARLRWPPALRRGERRHPLELERVAAEERVTVVADAAPEGAAEEELHSEPRRQIARVMDPLVLVRL